MSEGWVTPIIILVWFVGYLNGRRLDHEKRIKALEKSVEQLALALTPVSWSIPSVWGVDAPQQEPTWAVTETHEEKL